MQFNASQKEVTLKVVYYGPALSGKTTNLQVLHRFLDASARGQLATLDTKGDRTLFFDLLPVNFHTRLGWTVKLKLFTVPGQVVHESTRRIVLSGADAVVFVADSQRDQTPANNQSFKSMHDNLKGHGLDVNRIPTVIQFNKRDLPNIRSDAELAEIARRGREPIYQAIAVQGVGVVETFHGILGLLWQHLDAERDFSRKIGASREEFFASVFGKLGPTLQGEVRHG